MSKLFLSGALVLLLFCVACGYGRGSSGNPTPIGTFSNASLNGHYTYQLAGVDNIPNSFLFREAGAFTADGNGNITAGTDDVMQGGAPLSGSVTGSYAIGNDGTGTATLNVSNGRTLALALTLVSKSKVYFIIINANASGAGVAEKQDTGAFNAAPTGNLAFLLHRIDSNVPTGIAGQFNVTGGVVTGSEDTLSLGGATTPLTFTGLLNAPSSSGRGTGSFTDSSSVVSNFVYYVVSAGNIRILTTDSASLGLGRAEQQSAGPFSLSGSYAFGSQGDTNFAFHGVNTVGRFATSNGSISAGVFDFVRDGTVSANVQVPTGSYAAFDAKGRTTLTLNPTGGTPIQEIVWQVSPSRGFFLVDDPNKVEDGTLDLQQSSSFTNSTVTGQFALVMDGIDVSFNTWDRVGILLWDPIGNLTLNEAVNVSGTSSTTGFLPGSYSLSGNGRATGTIFGVTSNVDLVAYFVSGSNAYILQNDAGFQINGTISKQP